MESTKVTVIIPAYNRLDFLKECLESVAGQTFENFEVIVVDDASSEPIEQVVSSVDWPSRITWRLVRLETNKGPGGAREAGRQLARGDYIAYLDSDDLWFPRYLDEQIANLIAHPSASVSYCGYKIMGDRPRDRTTEDYRDGPVTKFLPEMFWGMNWVTNTIRVWRRDATDRIGPWLESRRSQDVNYSIRAGCFDMQCVCVPKILAGYREAHGLEQITQTGGTRPKIEIARSYLHAGDCLEESGKLESSLNSVPFAHLVFENAIGLLLLSEEKYSEVSLARIVRVAPMSSLIHWVSRFIRLNSLVFGPAFAGKVARRLNRAILRRWAVYHKVTSERR